MIAINIKKKTKNRLNVIQTKILKGLIVQLMNPGTLFNAQKNTSIYSYVSTLQREATLTSISYNRSFL